MMTPKEYAANAHAAKEQLYNGEPYVVHLDAVVAILTEYGFITQLYIDAGFLHDTLEDTDVSFEEVAALYSLAVAKIVFACSGEGHNRKARVANILSKIRGFADACIVKTADRIANVESAREHSPDLFKMYCNEKDAFIEVVAPQIPEVMLERLVAAHERT